MRHFSWHNYGEPSTWVRRIEWQKWEGVHQYCQKPFLFSVFLFRFPAPVTRSGCAELIAFRYKILSMEYACHWNGVTINLETHRIHIQCNFGIMFHVSYRLRHRLLVLILLLFTFHLFFVCLISCFVGFFFSFFFLLRSALTVYSPLDAERFFSSIMFALHITHIKSLCANKIGPDRVRLLTSSSSPSFFFLLPFFIWLVHALSGVNENEM